MNPLKTTLSGAIGILAGLHRDSITLDFSSIPTDAVTVAIHGDNGTGKSTLLNLGMTPWREPDHIKDIYGCFGPDGRRDLEFEHGGNIYRSVITYKQIQKTKKTTATLWLKNEFGDEPYVMMDKTASDGKTSTYDACLEELLGPKSLYYLSAFRHQGIRPLASHPDPKSLMRDLLSLSVPEQLSEQAKAVSRDLRRSLESIRGEVEQAARVGHRIAEIPAELASARSHLPALLASRRAATDAATDSRLRHELARAEAAENSETLQRRAAMAARLETARRRTSESIDAAEREVARASASVGNARAKTAEEVRRLDADIVRADRHGEETRTLANMDKVSIAEKSILEGEKRLMEQQLQIESLEKLRTEEMAKVEQFHQITGEVAKIRQQIVYTVGDGKRIAASCVDLRRRREYAADVPFGQRCIDAGCKALKDAIEAGSRLPAEELAVETKRKEWAILDHLRVDAETRLLPAALSSATVEKLEAQIKAERDTANNIGKLLDGYRRTAALRPSVERATSQVSELALIAQDLRARRVNLVSEAEKTEAEVFSAIAEMNRRIAKVKSEADRELCGIQSEIDRLNPISTNDAVVSSGMALTIAENSAQSASAEVEFTNAKIATLTAEGESLQKQLSRLSDVTATADRISSEISEWTLLSRALLGVIDLSIEDAGPAIAATANHLLRESYGTRFTIRIVSQKEQMNGVLKECFDISVLDGESDIESSLLDKSGGERVWLDEALRGAVGLYHQEAAGMQYECVFSDERDDGLTEERGRQFYLMDRAVLKAGGYKRKFFVSHKKAAWDTADYRINLDGYQAD